MHTHTYTYSTHTPVVENAFIPVQICPFHLMLLHRKIYNLLIFEFITSDNISLVMEYFYDVVLLLLQE